MTLVEPFAWGNHHLVRTCNHSVGCNTTHIRSCMHAQTHNSIWWQGPLEGKAHSYAGRVPWIARHHSYAGRVPWLAGTIPNCQSIGLCNCMSPNFAIHLLSWQSTVVDGSMCMDFRQNGCHHWESTGANMDRYV